MSLLPKRLYFVLLAIEDIPFVFIIVKERLNNQNACFKIAFDILEDILLNLYDHPNVAEFKSVPTFSER